MSRSFSSVGLTTFKFGKSKNLNPNHQTKKNKIKIVFPKMNHNLTDSVENFFDEIDGIISDTQEEKKSEEKKRINWNVVKKLDSYTGSTNSKKPIVKKHLFSLDDSFTEPIEEEPEEQQNTFSRSLSSLTQQKLMENKKKSLEFINTTKKETTFNNTTNKKGGKSYFNNIGKSNIVSTEKKKKKKKLKCSELVLGNKFVKKGRNVGEDDDEYLLGNITNEVRRCDKIICLGCDHSVKFYDDFKFDDDVDYLFCRLNYPDTIHKKLKKKPGTTAYCCQCKFVNVTGVMDNLYTTQLSCWKCTGH